MIHQAQMHRHTHLCAGLNLAQNKPGKLKELSQSVQKLAFPAHFLPVSLQIYRAVLDPRLCMAGVLAAGGA